MKTTDHFKNTIKSYLDNRAANDSLFAVAYAKEGKNIDDCVTYILNQVKNSGCNGFNDDEIYSMAVHYYDEDKIEVGKKIDSGRIVVNHVVQLTDEEKEEARKKAIADLQADILHEMKLKAERAAEKKAKKKPEVEFPTLF